MFNRPRCLSAPKIHCLGRGYRTLPDAREAQCESNFQQPCNRTRGIPPATNKCCAKCGKRKKDSSWRETSQKRPCFVEERWLDDVRQQKAKPCFPKPSECSKVKDILKSCRKGRESPAPGNKLCKVLKDAGRSRDEDDEVCNITRPQRPKPCDTGGAGLRVSDQQKAEYAELGRKIWQTLFEATDPTCSTAPPCPAPQPNKLPQFREYERATSPVGRGKSIPRNNRYSPASTPSRSPTRARSPERRRYQPSVSRARSLDDCSHSTGKFIRMRFGKNFKQVELPPEPNDACDDEVNVLVRYGKNVVWRKYKVYDRP